MIPKKAPKVDYYRSIQRLKGDFDVHLLAFAESDEGKAQKLKPILDVSYLTISSPCSHSRRYIMPMKRS